MRALKIKENKAKRLARKCRNSTYIQLMTHDEKIVLFNKLVKEL